MNSFNSFICVVGIDAYGATVLHVRHAFEDGSAFDGVITFPPDFDGDEVDEVISALSMTAARCRTQSRVTLINDDKVSICAVTNEDGMIVIREGWGDLSLPRMNVIRVANQAEHFRLFGKSGGPWQRGDGALRAERITIE